ncbi:MAG: succinate--CoA ligase subunit alpha [Myxococcota bacterium]|jgi:succinyl-CoA synthetase alpha subunit|nr:succinate--CoA ligase subunit alpha [Myxococcota bacterium]
MSILADNDTRIVVQGLGKVGQFHCDLMVEYGANVVAGTRPGKGGTPYNDVPVFNTVEQAVAETGANASVIFVPPPFAGEAIIEAAANGLDLIVTITEGIPTFDMLKAKAYVDARDCVLIGPNCPGIITPGQTKLGILPGQICKPGRVGVISRSGTLTYEAIDQLTQRGIGQSTCIGIGGDPVIGTTHLDAMKMFNADSDTDAVVMIGEIGGQAEEDCAAWVADNMTKPVVGFIAGATAPPGRRMGHAGAIIAGGKGTAAEKFVALEEAGIHVAYSPAEIGEVMEGALS